MPKELSKKEKQGFGIKKTDPAYIVVKADSPFEFDDDRSPLIVCDWDGNFANGEFTLNTTRIEKRRNRELPLLLRLLQYLQVVFPQLLFLMHLKKYLTKV